MPAGDSWLATWEHVSDRDDPKGRPSIRATRDVEAGRSALRELGEVVEEILAKTGLTEDELVRELGGD